MINKAKVSLSAVQDFEKTVTALRDCSFDKGVSCVGEYQRYISDLINGLRDSIENMNASKDKLENKKNSIYAELSQLSNRLESLQQKRSEIENDLENTPEYITMYNEDGEEYEESNPDYIELESELEDVDSEIDSVDTELDQTKQRLEYVQEVDRKLASHIHNTQTKVDLLEEKRDVCKSYRAALEEIKEYNHKRGTIAVDSLKRIEKIIGEYRRVKISYNDVSSQGQAGISRWEITLNANINHTTPTSGGKEKDKADNKTCISKEDIAKHNIVFGSDGRISLYDNKTFGGKYNSYETRLSHASPDDNPILGYYEGAKGESRYIPSDRNAEGIIVIDILSNYGLTGIDYRNAEPDFEVCSEAIVKISDMTENRDNYIDSTGNRKLGNFSQADIECAKIWNEQAHEGRSNWRARDVYNYRQANRLTWHEKCDTETVVLVRSEINAYFKHSGGCSECRTRDGLDNRRIFDEED